ncbi:unnamed protein product [Prorocentrum cordatum]|uniref:Protein kinase domain-containing protein n=1 Tax=Prorocentrum cordatum TaxID=2364126 RepID=A0ABN9U4G2_9DINO|nr:unnamed protein product [Polarella glacialis]
MALERDYEVLKQLGEGAFGKVYKAQHRGTGDVVAVKQIKLGSRSWDEALKSMELQALKALRHPFIVRLRELMRSPQDGSLYYVFEFLGSDLFRHIREHPNGLEEPRAAELSRQLLSALGHMHQLGFFHRDVKPENILFDVPSSTIRLADFGETRSLRARPPFTDYVGTRWYRAPECLLRFRAYSSPVDVWAAGLVLAEMLRGSALFCGSSAIDQLYKVFQVLGSSGTSDWPEFRQLAGEMRFRLPDGQGCGLGRCLPGCSPLAQAAVGEILVPNPRRRPAAKRAPAAPYCPGLGALLGPVPPGGALGPVSPAASSAIRPPPGLHLLLPEPRGPAGGGTADPRARPAPRGGPRAADGGAPRSFGENAGGMPEQRTTLLIRNLQRPLRSDHTEYPDLAAHE